MLVSLLVWALVGLIAGWLAGQFTKGSDFGLVGNIVVGLIGALVGGFLAQAIFGVDPVDGLDISTILTSFIGAIIFLGLLNMISGRRRLDT
ncbi:MAG: GlsB/YeaQ/YmgE family stress response membrane protein [Ardenticatenales bacterium]|nr:GlsB/YeaQ/YmgE family stress response membrane protein [Ardenticatenales bacterium]